jgi:O-antigen ligase
MSRILRALRLINNPKVRLDIVGFLLTLFLTAILILLLARSTRIAVLFVVGLLALFFSLRNPYSVLLVFFVQLPLVPRWGELLGVRIPNTLTPFCLLASFSALGCALASQKKDILKPRIFDICLVAWLCILGFSIKHDENASITMKFFQDSLFIPVLIYFAVRWLDLSHSAALRLLRALALASTCMALILLSEFVLGRSFLYQGVSEKYIFGSIYQAGAAFSSPTTAGSFLVLVLPFLCYFAAKGIVPIRALPRKTRKGFFGKRFFAYALALGLAGIGLSLERGVWLGAVVALLICAFSKELRPLIFKVALISLILLPLPLLAMKGTGWIEQRVTESGNLSDRIRMIDAAIGIVHSAQWSPLRGIGLERYPQVAYLYMPARSFFEDRALEADWGRAAHNDFLTVLVECGVPGGAAYLAIIGLFVSSALRLLRRGKSLRADTAVVPIDQPLVIALLASGCSVFVLALTHNTLQEAQLLVIFWLVAGLVVAKRPLLLEEERA